ncbi:DUF6193 family natural product biosynthesis protein [Streptomyces sp. HUAS MG47]|uniref:DUF6193 family natural product biosynthesis protein n=1 Tax=Streptomyces solicamelliae TaxID=3231716 RepID=UPI003877E2B0
MTRRRTAATAGGTGRDPPASAPHALSSRRALSPGPSMYWLTFSRRAAPPICHDLPRAMPLGNGRYRVRFADGRLRELDSAAEAVALVMEGLPDDARS